MEIPEVIALINYWQTLLDVQSAYLNPNITAKLFATVEALEAYQTEHEAYKVLLKSYFTSREEINRLNTGHRSVDA